MSASVDLRDLYQELVLDHGRHPRNRRIMTNPTHQSHSENPLCGDELVVFLKTDDRRVIREISFEGQACAIATASASLMTEALLGKTPAEGRILFEHFSCLITSGVAPPLDGMADEMHRLATLAGVRVYSMRIKCALLAWETMLAALENPGK